MLSAALLGTVANPATATAQPDVGGALCALGPVAVSDWVKKAKNVKYANYFGAAIGFLANSECRKAVDKLSLGQTTEVAVQRPNGAKVPLRLNFDDLAVNDVTLAPPRSTKPESLMDIVERVQLRSSQCSGYKYRVLFDMCMDGDLEPLYR